jgi:hypothetical protein
MSEAMLRLATDVKQRDALQVRTVPIQVLLMRRFCSCVTPFAYFSCVVYLAIFPPAHLPGCAAVRSGRVGDLGQVSAGPAACRRAKARCQHHHSSRGAQLGTGTFLHRMRLSVA